MNDSCKEFAFIIQRDYLIAIILIILTIIAKELKEYLHLILENNLILIIQIMSAGLVVLLILREMWRIRSHIKIEIKQGGKLKKIFFISHLIMMSLGTAYIIHISFSIFLLNLFPIAYGISNPIRENYLALQDVFSFTIYPFLSWFNFHMLRKNYLSMPLEENKFNNIICLFRKYWIWSSLFILIILNLGLIISGFEFRLM